MTSLPEPPGTEANGGFSEEVVWRARGAVRHAQWERADGKPFHGSHSALTEEREDSIARAVLRVAATHRTESPASPEPPGLDALRHAAEEIREGRLRHFRQQLGPRCGIPLDEECARCRDNFHALIDAYGETMRALGRAEGAAEERERCGRLCHKEASKRAARGQKRPVEVLRAMAAIIREGTPQPTESLSAARALATEGEGKNE